VTAPNVDPTVVLFDEAVRFARGCEKILAVMTLLGASSSMLAEAYEVDPDLVPELSSALGSLVDAGDALGRAVGFLNARLTVRTGGDKQ